MIDDPGRISGGTLGDYMSRSDIRSERSMGEVVKDIIGNVQDMMRSEMRLAKAEIREEAGKTMSAAKVLGIGAVLGLFAAGFLLLSVVQLLALAMPVWLASLIVGAVLAMAGFAMISKGKSHLRLPTPQKTIENVKENVEWMKNQTRS
jgi:uncharacterized membrane protein YqjE